MTVKISANLREKKPHFRMDFAVPRKTYVGVPNWHLHATMIDVETLGLEPSTPMRVEEPCF
jgi:hypothetical protein